jgi:hypothetical protein
MDRLNRVFSATDYITKDPLRANLTKSKKITDIHPGKKEINYEDLSGEKG